MLNPRAPRRVRTILMTVGALGALGVAASPAAAAISGVGPASWPTAAQSSSGERNQPLEFQIGPQNVSQLAPKWVFTDHGDVSATPTVANGVVYFPDFGGYLNAVNAQTGALIWQSQIDSYPGETASTPANPIVARDSPLILGHDLIVGDNASSAQPNGAHVIAVNALNGNLVWSTEVDSNPAAIITSSPVAYGDEIVVGIASNEEADAESPSYPCCSFRGAVVALNARNGKILWKTYTVPSSTSSSGDSNTECTSANPAAGCSYTGGAVWGVPTIDAATGQVFVGTGNNYTAPDAAVACETAALNADPPQNDADCTAPDDYFDAELALNLQTGAIEWGYKSQGWDAFTLACLSATAGINWCPDPEGPDWDFSAGPNLMAIPASGGGFSTAVGAGQKSGLYWEFDPATGTPLWHVQVGPGTNLGGVMWGTAYDGTRIYVHESDPYFAAYTFANGTTVNGGSWGALNPSTGAWDWQTATPGGAAAMGPVTVANGVVYGGTTAAGANADNMFAMNAATGAILWRFASGGSVNSGPAVVNGTVYWGSGYSELSALGYTGNTKLYAFTIGGH